MIIKKIEGDTMLDCLGRAKNLFGFNAKIHSSNKLANGRYQIVASGSELVSPISVKKQAPDRIDLDSDSFIEEFVSSGDEIKSIQLDIKKISDDLNSRMDRIGQSIDDVGWGIESKLNPSSPKVISMLIDNGLSYSDAKSYCINLPRNINDAVNRVKSQIVNSASFGFDFGKGIHSFFGPSGCGKTTTMIKLAIMKANAGFNCCMIVGEASSPGAVEEMRSISKITGIDVFVSVKKVPKSTYDFIFMDNPSDKIIDSKIVNNHLVSSSSTIPAVYNDFISHKNKFSSIIITKMDENRNIATHLSMSNKIGAPISFTNASNDISASLVSIDSDDAAMHISLTPSFDGNIAHISKFSQQEDNNLPVLQSI